MMAKKSWAGLSPVASAWLLKSLSTGSLGDSSPTSETKLASPSRDSVGQKGGRSHPVTTTKKHLKALWAGSSYIKAEMISQMLEMF